MDDNSKSFPQLFDRRNDSRRNFMKKLLAAVPAVGAACMLPAGSFGATPDEKWVCLTHLLWGGSNWQAYLATNCFDQYEDVAIFQPGLPLGDCETPQEPSCWRLAEFAKWERSNDEYEFVFAPSLEPKGRAAFESEKMRFIANINKTKVA